MAPHGVDGWYVGPSLDHYGCHQSYIPSTSQSWNILIVDWFPHTVPFPKVDTDGYLRQTANNMLSLLHGQKENQSPLAFGSTTKNTFIQIGQILCRATSLPIPTLLTPVPESRVVQAPPIAAPIPSVTQARVMASPSLPQPVLPRPPPTATTTKPGPATPSATPHPGPGTSTNSPLAPQNSLPCPLFSPSPFPPQIRPPHCRPRHNTHRREASIPDKATSWPLVCHMVAVQCQQMGRLLEFGFGRDRPIAEQIEGTDVGISFISYGRR
jgi:hypothetical protein